MRALTVLFAIVALVAVAQEKKGKGLQLRDLPAAVQKTVQAHLMGGEIKSIGKEKENGVEQYEVESVLNGNSRDFNVDIEGNLLLVEVATTLDAIPAAAKASILKKQPHHHRSRHDHIEARRTARLQAQGCSFP